jgi:hypothetical protein
MAGIKDAYADMTKPPPGKNRGDFVTLYGLAGLNAYVVERRAEIILPLLIAIQRRLDMTRKARTPLSAKVWKDAGSPPKNRRVSILAQLRRMPELVVLLEARHFTFRYRVGKGPVWIEIEKAAWAGAGKEGEEDDEE